MSETAAKKDKTMATTEKAEPKTLALDAAPEVIGDGKQHLFVSPHDLTEDVDPNYAGDYELTHGTIRIPSYDGKGELLPRGKVYRAGAKLRLGAIDAYRFLLAKVVKRIDNKTPNEIDVERELAAKSQTVAA